MRNVRVSVFLPAQVKAVAVRRAQELRDERSAKDASAAEGYRLLEDEARDEAELAVGTASDW